MWCVSGVAPRRRALLFLFLLSLMTMMTMMLFLLMLLRVRKPCNHLLHVFSLHLHLHLALLLESIISSSRVEEQLRHILCTFFLARRGVFCQKFLLLFLQMLFTLPRYTLFLLFLFLSKEERIREDDFPVLLFLFLLVVLSLREVHSAEHQVVQRERRGFRCFRFRRRFHHRRVFVRSFVRSMRLFFRARARFRERERARARV